MQNNQQQAYDRGTTVFSPDGRLYQVEYAREAVKQGSPAVGIRTDDGVVLGAAKRVRSPLLEAESVEKVHRVDDHLAAASAGNVADGRQLVDFARRVAQGERLRYGEPIDVEALTKTITDHVQEYTQTGGARPFGVAMLVAGVDPEPSLYEVDPGGTPTAWKAAAIGARSGETRSFLESEYDEGIDLAAGTDLALEALATGTDDDLDPASTILGVVDAETDQYRELETTEVRDRLAELEILDEGDDADEEN
jgi:proteasome alpha subunit